MVESQHWNGSVPSLSRSCFVSRSNLTARVCVIYFYCVEGYLSSTWSVNLSSIQEHLDLNDGQLGIAVLCAYLFMTLAAPISAILVYQYGTSSTTLLASLLYCASLPLIASSNSAMGVIFTFSFYGLSCGIMDTAMNSSAVLVEFVAEKEIMGSIHGMYSVAAAAGSIIAGQINHIGWSVQVVFSTIGGVFFLFSLLFGRGMYSFEEERLIVSKMECSEDSLCHATMSQSSACETTCNENKVLEVDTGTVSQADSLLVHKDAGSVLSAAWFVPEDSRLVVFQALCLCTTGFLSVFGESIMSTWLLIYIRRYIDGSHQISGAGLSIFYICEALGRFFCDYLRGCYGRKKVILIGGCLACTGLIILLCVPQLIAPSLVMKIALSYAGTILAGFGYSMLYPTLISSAGSLPGISTGMAVSMVTFSTSCGSIIGPALIGGLSVLFGSLRTAFIFNACFISLIIPLSFGIRGEGRASEPSISSSLDCVAYEKIAESVQQEDYLRSSIHNPSPPCNRYVEVCSSV